MTSCNQDGASSSLAEGMVAFSGRVSKISDLPDDCLTFIFQKLSRCSDCEAFGLVCRRWLRIQNASLLHLKVRSSHKDSSISKYLEYLPRLLKRFHSISSLSLAGCSVLPNEAVIGLRFRGSKLTKLSLDCCFSINNGGLSSIAIGCPNLVSISMYRCDGIGDAGMESLSRYCSNLENVNLSCCMLVSDVGIAALRNGCLGLRAVNVSRCRRVTGTGFRGCSNLVYLEAESCLLTQDGLSQITTNRNLELLDISGLGGWMGGDTLGSIGAIGMRLKFLNLRMCRFVGDLSVFAIAKGCPLLKELNLVLCHEVRIAGWQAISLDCKSLEVLHVNRCHNLCDRSLKALQDGCCCLKKLYIQGCSQVTVVGLDLFKCVRIDVKVELQEMVSFGPGKDMFLRV